MKFDFDKYKDQKVVMHCKTEEETIDFCRVMDEAGLCWYNGRSYKERNNYDWFNEKTCYNFNKGGYSGISFYRAENFEILEWSDFMNKQFSKSDLRNGDVCVQRDGIVEIAIVDLGCFLVKSGYNLIDEFNENLEYNDSEFNIHDIVKVYRPKHPCQCCFEELSFAEGELVFDRAAIEPVDVTLEEIAKLKGVSVDRIRIVNG